MVVIDMKSIQVGLGKERIEALDRLVASGLYSSPNEAVREAVRRPTVECMQAVEFRCPVFGPRTEDEMKKLLASCEDVRSVKPSREAMAAREESIRL